jgi:hypothetical protein
LLRQRSHEALKQKARRGALFLGVAAGYVKVGRIRIEKDPDQRVHDALKVVFSKFAAFQSARQMHIWPRGEGIALPVKSHDAEGCRIVWRLPAYNTVHNILTNPNLRRRPCVRADNQQAQRREWAQVRAPWIASSTDGVG